MSALEQEVRRRACERCEYCHVPQSAFRRKFHIEHIVARQHGGATELGNLALACWNCNFRKGPNLAGIDAQSGLIVPLFHPRRDAWTSHFAARVVTEEPPGVTITGLTPTGRATVHVLDLNDNFRRVLRYEFWREGLFEAQK
jgi:hypothetical protein